MQRLGRKGHPVYRVVVQDSRQSPDSGKYVARLGSYDPHTKATTLNKEKAEFYLTHGAQPSDRVVALFKAEKIKLPSWVKEASKQKREIKNPEKLRRNRPAEEAAEEELAAEAPAEDSSADDAAAEAEAPKDADKPSGEAEEPQTEVAAEEAQSAGSGDTKE